MLRCLTPPSCGSHLKEIVWGSLKKSAREVKAPIARSHCQSRPNRGLRRIGVFLSLDLSLALSWIALLWENKLPACFSYCARRRCVATPSPRVSQFCMRIDEMWQWERRWRPDDLIPKVRKRRGPAASRLLARARARAPNVKFQGNGSGEQW